MPRRRLSVIRRRLSITRPVQYGARINPAVNSSWSLGSSTTIDRRTDYVSGTQRRILWRYSRSCQCTLASLALSGISLLSLEDTPQTTHRVASRRVDDARSGINYSGGSSRVFEGAALFSGRPPAQFRSLARQERERDR